MPPTYQSSFKYTYKHLRTFYPLELINVIYGVYLYNKKLNLTDLQILILNILIMKTWSRYSKLASCFNGISWFLSALLFCYFLTPFLLGGIKNFKNSLILFLLVSFIRISIQIIIKKGGLNVLDVHFHRGPVIRCMEFYLGMLTIPLFFKCKKFLDKFINILWIKILFTIVQIIFPFGIYYFMLYFNFILARCYFVLIFCVGIFIIGFDYGLLSNLFEMKISKIIMNCQMEMYLLQNTVNSILSKIMIKMHLKFPPNLEVEYHIKLVIIFIFALIYKNIFKTKLAKAMDKIVYLIKNIFQ
jgi:peptidoglycan/LPS O-acetylase OafA/YrhL